jgi:hypothetical protein
VRWASLGVYSCLLLTWYGTVVRWYGTMVRYCGTVGIPCHAIYSCLLLTWYSNYSGTVVRWYGTVVRFRAQVRWHNSMANPCTAKPRMVARNMVLEVSCLCFPGPLVLPGTKRPSLMLILLDYCRVA